jgi:iron-sulfur cluster assembly protein
LEVHQRSRSRTASSGALPVNNGGFSRFKYGPVCIEERALDDDMSFEPNSVRMRRQPSAQPHRRHHRLRDSMQGSGFTFTNPNATGGCGCGSSFTA